MFSCEYSENFKNIYFEKRRTGLLLQLWTTALECLLRWNKTVNFNLVETMQFQFYLSKQVILNQLNWRTWYPSLKKMDCPVNEYSKIAGFVKKFNKFNPWLLGFNINSLPQY